MSRTPSSGVDYAERILGAQPTERQRAEISQAMLKHGIATDHPVLGVICEMILYRDKMENYVARIEAASKVANNAQTIVSDKEEKIKTHLASLTARIGEMEEAARQRLEQPIREFEQEMNAKRDKLEKQLQEAVEKERQDIYKYENEVRSKLNQAMWRSALSFRWGAILAAGGLGLGLGLGFGGGWGLWHSPQTYTEVTCEAAGGNILNFIGSNKEVTGYRCAFPAAKDLPAPPPLPPASKR